MLKFSDRLFRKFFMGLVSLALMLVFVLSMHLFLGINLDSRPLWGGSILAFLAINLVFDINGVIKKIFILGVSSVILGTFFNAVLNWSLAPSLLTGTVILMLSVLLYMSFLH